MNIINKEFFEFNVKERDTSKDLYPGGGIQIDVFSLKNANGKRTPLARCFVDEHRDADDLENTIVRAKSTLKKDKRGNDVIQVKITKSSHKYSENVALIAIPFKGQILGVEPEEGVQILKMNVKQIEKTKFGSTTYTKVLYIIASADVDHVHNPDKGDITVKLSNVKKFNPNQGDVKFNLSINDVIIRKIEEPNSMEINVVSMEKSLTKEQVDEKSVRVEFNDLVKNICYPNAEKPTPKGN